MNASVDITNYLPFLATLLGGGVAVSLIAQAAKKAFGLNSGHVIHLMVVALSVVAAVAQYVLQAKNLPASVLGLNVSTVYAASQFAYNESGYLKTLLGRVNISLSDPAAPAQAAAAAATPAADPAAPAVPAEVTPADAPSAENSL